MRWPRVALIAGGAAALALTFLHGPVSAELSSLQWPGSASARPASLTVTITSLPRQVPADVTVTGPNHFFRRVPVSATLRNLSPGGYVVQAGPVSTRSGVLYPVNPDVSVQLQPGGSSVVQVSYGDTVPDTTKVVPASSVVGLSGSAAGPATLTLSGLPSGLIVGDVIAIGVTQATPDGFLGKVTALSQTTTGYQVSTVPATLEEAIPDGAIDPPWTEPQQDESLDDSGVSCGTDASLSVTDNLSLTPGGQFAAQWANGTVTSASFDGSLTLSQQLQAAVDGAASCTVDNHPLLAAPVLFTPIVVDVGDIPVVLVPELQFILNADASTQASLTESATLTDTATAGLDYANGQLTPVSSFTTGFTPQVPTPDLQADLSASVGPTLSLLIDGIAGPDVNVGGSLGLHVSPLSSPAWTLTGGLQAGGGLTSPILDLDESNPSIISNSVILDTSPPVITTTPLAAGTTGTAYSQTLTASSGTPPYQWSVSSGALPPGLSLDPATGTISGTPTQSGSFSFTIQVTDSSVSTLYANGQTASEPESITVATSMGGGGGGGGGGGWSPTEAPLPSDASAAPDVQLPAVTCASTSSCLAVGAYMSETSASFQGLLLTGSGTSWSATEAPLLAGGSGPSGNGEQLVSAACPSATSCVAVGSYTNNGPYPLVLSGSDSSWTPTEPVPPVTINYDGGELNSLACSSASACTAVGYYDVAGYILPLLVTGSGSSWTATEAPLPSNAGADPQAYLTSVACPSASSCVASGYYTDSSGNQQGLLLSGSGSSWTATEAPLPSNAEGTDIGTLLTSVACPSASSCVAVGYYTDSSGHEQGLLVTGSGSSWTATEAPLPADADGTPQASLTSVACPSASSCVAAGLYDDSSVHQQGLLLTGSGTSWTATEAPLPAGAGSNPGGRLASVACPSTSSCVAVGYYTDSSGNQQGLLLSGSGSSWTATEASLPANAGSNPDGFLTSVACPSTSSCVVSGYYTDSSGNQQGLLITGSG